MNERVQRDKPEQGEVNGRGPSRRPAQVGEDLHQDREEAEAEDTTEPARIGLPERRSKHGPIGQPIGDDDRQAQSHHAGRNQPARPLVLRQDPGDDVQAEEIDDSQRRPQSRPGRRGLAVPDSVPLT